jgi:3-phosphoshikimate 1-carboxyvinyltransferase
MTERVLPGPLGALSARVDLPASKSLTNRALVAAAVAGGGVIRNPLDCEDTRLLARALADAGWELVWGEEIRIGPRRATEGTPTLWLGNSGTGARLLLGLLAASPGRCVVDGTPRLRERPMGPLLEALKCLGARVHNKGEGLPITVDGLLMDGGRVHIRPEVSSQFVSSLLLAGPLTRQGLEVEVEGEIPSLPYLDLTEDILREFGVQVDRSPSSDRWFVPGGTADASDLTIEGDWSAAAFPAAAAAVVGGEVSVGPLSIASRQGDRQLCRILESAGVDVSSIDDRVVFRGPARRPLDADLGDTPDLFPSLAVVAATLPGSLLSGLDHLKHKESDRLAVMVDNLGRLGCEVELEGSSFSVRSEIPRRLTSPVEVTAAGDHRIAMAMAVAALIAGQILLDDADCVAKSFPGFWSAWHDMTRSSGFQDPEP